MYFSGIFPSAMSCVKGIVITVEKHNESEGVAEWGINMHHAVNVACASILWGWGGGGGIYSEVYRFVCMYKRQTHTHTHTHTHIYIY